MLLSQGEHKDWCGPTPTHLQRGAGPSGTLAEHRSGLWRLILQHPA